jgi:hypothetical protein
MGIEAALIGGSVASSLVSGYGANKAGKTAQRGFQQGAQQATGAIDQSMQQALGYLSPYMNFGEQALPYLQQYLQQGAPQQFQFDAQAYQASPEFQNLQAMNEQSVLRNASATSGMRSGGANAALAGITPQLLAQERGQQLNEFNVNQGLQQQRFGNLFNLTQFGAGFGQNAAQMAMGAGADKANYMYNSATGGANARAQGQNAMFGGIGQAAQDLGTGFYGFKKGFI